MALCIALVVAFTLSQVVFGRYSFDRQIDAKNPPPVTYSHSTPQPGNPYQTLVGVSGDAGSQDGLASLQSTTITAPQFVWGDSAGTVYFTDPYNHVVRSVGLDGELRTFAGIKGSSGFNDDGLAATSTTFFRPRGLFGDNTRVLVCDIGNARIRSVSLSSPYTVNTIAGDGTRGYSGDGGLAVEANVHSPYAVWVNKDNGDVFFTELHQCTIRKISGGIITTVVGVKGTCGFNGDGFTATATHLNAPRAIFGDALTGTIFWTEVGSNTARKLVGTTVTTLVGLNVMNDVTLANNVNAGDGGKAVDAVLRRPTGIWVDRFGNVYIAESFAGVVRKIDAVTKDISTFLGVHGVRGPFTKNVGTNALFHPRGIWGDESVNYKLYLPDTDNHRIVMVDLPRPTETPTTTPSAIPTEIPTALPTAVPTTEVPTAIPTAIPTTWPTAIPTAILTAVPSVAPTTEVPTAIPTTAVTTQVPTRSPTASPTVTPGIINTIAGNGGLLLLTDNVSPLSSTTETPIDGWTDTSGNIYFIHYQFTTYNVVRKITSATNIISTFAGAGISTSAVTNGRTAVTARFNNLQGCFGDDSGLFVADMGHGRVYKISWSTNNPVTTFAGGGTTSFATGASSSASPIAATSVNLGSPTDIWGYNGDYYIFSQDCVVYKVSGGMVSILAGVKDSCQFGASTLQSGYGIAGSANGAFVVVGGGSSVKKISTTTGQITRVAGTGTTGTAADGALASTSNINTAQFPWVDTADNIYFFEANFKVRVISATTGALGTVAGTGVRGYSGENVDATTAKIGYVSLWGDTSNNLYLGDYDNNRVRKITNLKPVTVTVTRRKLLTADEEKIVNVFPSSKRSLRRV